MPPQAFGNFLQAITITSHCKVTSELVVKLHEQNVKFFLPYCHFCMVFTVMQCLMNNAVLFSPLIFWAKTLWSKSYLFYCFPNFNSFIVTGTTSIDPLETCKEATRFIPSLLSLIILGISLHVAAPDHFCDRPMIPEPFCRPIILIFMKAYISFHGINP